MHLTSQSRGIKLDALPESDFWSKANNTELSLHKIHAYPAKFPSLLVSKSFEYAKKRGISVNRVGDIFCGCGTTALEAKLRGVDFWGCDINPVATLIARVKSTTYQEKLLLDYLNKILNYANSHKSKNNSYFDNERIRYWFQDKEIIELHSILKGIYETVPNGKYQDFFLCAFSNILKKCSLWLTKSIKPQKDKTKIPANPKDSFVQQAKFMMRANNEFRKLQIHNASKSEIITSNFLSTDLPRGFLDLVVTSPPYAVSYEYADLHQLSALWLGYAQDYRELRDGSIGSTHNIKIDSDSIISSLNPEGANTYRQLKQKDSDKARSVAKYFLDLESTVNKVKQLLKKDSLAIFVIGDTKYKGVEVSNTKYLISSLFDNGFKDVWVYKRRIASKSLTPYRDSIGRFSASSDKRHVYSHEHIVTASL